MELFSDSQQRPEGLNDTQLRNINSIKFKPKKDVSENEREKCVICYENFEDEEEVKSLPCIHLFHSDCIYTWLKDTPSCPICKTSVV